MITPSTIDFYLSRPGVRKRYQGNTLVIESPNQLIAEGLLKSAFHLASWLGSVGKEKAIIRHPADEGFGFPVYRWYAVHPNSAEEKPVITTTNYPNRPTKAEVNFESSPQEILQFITNKTGEGLVVIIARMSGDDILFVNDNMPTERILVSKPEMLDKRIFDNSRAWRDSRLDRIRLEELLNREQFIPGYEHSLRRLDNSMARYAHDFYLVNYLGVPSRLVVSRPGDYEVIAEEALV